MESTEHTVDEIVAEQAAIVAVVEETAVEAAEIAAAQTATDPSVLQAEVAKDRKAMGLSRRALADSIGWTESRVWYLEQAGVRLDVQRNVEDLSSLLVHMTELRVAGWAKPTVKTAARTAKAAKKDEGWFTKDQLDEALAASVKAAEDLRAKHADQLAALKQTVEVKLAEAKAKKAGTAALVAIQGMIDDMVWES